MPTITHHEPTVEELQRELARLRADFDSRVAELERRLAPAKAPVEPAPAPRMQVSAEFVAVIAAAVTSFLGKKVKIHNVHLLDSGTNPWAQQGRAIIQASHNLVR